MTMLSRKGDAAKRMNRKGSRRNSRLTSLCAVLLVLATVLSMPGMAMAGDGAADVGMPDGGVLITEVPGDETSGGSEGASDGSGEPAGEVAGGEAVVGGQTYAVIASASDPSSNDLGDYITPAEGGMTLQKKNEAGKWVPLGDEGIVLGNNYKLSVHFEAPDGGQFPANPMEWDLGDSVKCQPVTGGVIWDGNTIIGSYDLTEDGHVTVTFTEEYMGRSKHTLDMEFEMVPMKNPDEGGGEFPWKGHITDEHKVENKAVLDVEKTAGWYDSSKGSITYTVEASCTEGMVVDGVLTDVLGDGLTFRDVNSMKVYDANGRDVTDQYQSYIDELQRLADDAEDKEGTKKQKSFTLSPLPPLSQGMRFVVEYESRVDATKQADMSYVAENTVTFSGNAPDGEPAIPDSQTAEKPLAKDQITKEGNTIVIEENGEEKEVIQWQVRVGSGQWDPLSQDLTVVDELGTGLSFRKSEGFKVEWCSEDGTVKKTVTIPEGSIVFDGKTATYYLNKKLFGDDYVWADGDYLMVTYNTDYDRKNQPANGFENTVKNDILAPEGGVTGRLPVGEAVQKTLVEEEEEGYLDYTVVVDVPPVSHMTKMDGEGKDDHVGECYFYIEDRLDFGDNYFVLNIPEDLTIRAVSKDSDKTWDFAEVEYTYGPGDNNKSRQTYQIVQGSESSNIVAGKNTRAFCIFFNTACYGIGGDDKLDHHDSIWNIDEATQLIIKYRIPYDSVVVDQNGKDTGMTLEQVLKLGLQLENRALSKRRGVELDDRNYLQKTPEETSIDKTARVLSGGEVEYRVTFVNSDEDSSRLINNKVHDNGSLSSRHYKNLDPTLTDEFDERMEYVEGSLYVEVRDRKDGTLYDSFKYTGKGPVEGNKLTAHIVDFTEQTGDKHTFGTIGDSFGDRYTYEFVYKLRLKEEYRKDWETDRDITNKATFTYGESHPSDNATVSIPSDMLQKDFVKTNSGLKYTLNVNALALDLVTDLGTGEQKVNPNSYKLVDEMSKNLSLLTTTQGDYDITVQYKDGNNWLPLTLSSDATGISKEKHNYFLGTDENGDLYFILPDELAIQITYEVKVNGPLNSQEYVTNKATLYADHTETDERKTVYDVGTSGGSGSSAPTMRLQKIESGNDMKVLKDAVFGLYSTVGEGDPAFNVQLDGKEVPMYFVKDYTTDEFGVARQISPAEDDKNYEGLYVLVEKTAPDGYVNTETPIFFRFPNYEGTAAGGEVEYNGKKYTIHTPAANYTFTVENPPENKLRVKKVDSSAASDNNGLADAVFELWSAPREEGGSALYTGKSNAEGLVEWTEGGTLGSDGTTDLHLDGGEGRLYYLYETKAPNGYTPLEGPVEVKVAPDGTVTVDGMKVEKATDGTPTMVVEIPNDSSFELPESGGVGTAQLYVMGSLLLLAAGMALVCEDRRRKASR